jgi:hypothetical protein
MTQKPTEPAIGDKMSDGTYYAGLSYETGKPACKTLFEDSAVPGAINGARISPRTSRIRWSMVDSIARLLDSSRCRFPVAGMPWLPKIPSRIARYYPVCQDLRVHQSARDPPVA